VAEVIGGDGGDAAIVPRQEGDLVLAAEAIAPGLVARSPRVAGVAGVVATLNDLAASGAMPVALLDTVVGGDEATVRELLAGVAEGARLYGVPVVGGHTTVADDEAPALSVFGAGGAVARPSIAHARPGDALCLIACLEGEVVQGPEGQVLFSHLRGPRRDRAGEDLRRIPEAAAAGEIGAARDVSMPGLAGSLVQMLEGGDGLGCALRIADVPRPQGVGLGRWLCAFPSYGFLVVGDAGALADRFGGAGLTVAEVGILDDSGAVRLSDGGQEELVWDLAAERLTGLTDRPA
jgi:uncharacterized protein